MATVRNSARRGGRTPRYTVEQVREHALALIDAEGLQAFSMRRLAEAMEIGPMTLYGYVRTSDEILDGVLELALDGLFDDLDEQLPWEQQLHVAVCDLHTALRAHPGALELLLAKPSPSHQLDRLREALLAILRRAGFKKRDAWEGVGTLGSYAIGFASSQISFRHLSAPTERLRALPVDAFPNLSGLASGYPAHVSDEAFERGLRYLIEGMRSEL
ncbi:MAG: TetR/AcrR family transcriptional regulator [Solirubrobacteraceae bacterium]